MLVTVKIMGKPAQVLENFTGATIADVKAFLELEGNYTYNLGGSPASETSALTDGAYLVFAPSVKGAFAKKKETINPNKSTKKVKTVKKTKTTKRK